MSVAASAMAVQAAGARKPKKKEYQSAAQSEDVPPIIESMPWFCPRPRAKLFLWYPGPTIMGHKMHWTEWVFVILLTASIVVLVIGPETFPVDVYSISLAGGSWVGLIFVWGIARYKSLADMATQLEQVAAKNHAQVNMLEELNEGWDKGLQESEANLNKFVEQLGLVENAAQDIDKVANVLSGLVTQKKKIQAEEKGCFEVSVKHQKCTRQEIEEKKRSLMKRKLVQVYARFDKDKSGTIDNPDEIDKLRQRLMEDEFLNLVDEETGAPRFNWLEEFEAVAEDGAVDLFELLNVLDKVTDSYFLQVQFSVQRREELRKELAELRAKYNITDESGNDSFAIHVEEEKGHGGKDHAPAAHKAHGAKDPAPAAHGHKDTRKSAVKH